MSIAEQRDGQWNARFRLAHIVERADPRRTKK